MKRIRLLVFLFFLLVGCDDGVYSSTLIFDGRHTFGPQTWLPGDVLLRAGTTELAAGSQVAGSIYVLGGTLVANGQIDGDLAVLDGEVRLGPDAVIFGDLRTSGGKTQQADTAVIRGQTITGLALPMDGVQAQPGGWEATFRWLIGVLLLAALGGMWAQWQSRRQTQPLRNVADAALIHWLPSTALGLLGLLVLPILLVMMAFTVVLIPLVFVLGLIVSLVWAMGVVSLGALLGEWMTARWLKPMFRRSMSPGWTTFTGTVLLMGLFALPWVGEALFGLTAVLLLGAVLLSRFGTRAYEPPPTVVMAEDLSVYERP